MIYTVRHLLSLKAKAVLRSLRITALEGIIGILHKVCRIELNAGRIGVDHHFPVRLGVAYLYPRSRPSVLDRSEIHAMIVSARNSHRLVRKIKILTDRLFNVEIEGSADYGAKLARGDKIFICGKEGVAIHPQNVIKHLARGKASEMVMFTMVFLSVVAL